MLSFRGKQYSLQESIRILQQQINYYYLIRPYMNDSEELILLKELIALSKDIYETAGFMRSRNSKWIFPID